MTDAERERQPNTTAHDSIPAETGKNDGVGTSGDCISRQAALETIRTMQTYKLFAGDDMILVDKAQVQTELMMLPSTQPEIIRCKDCEYLCNEYGLRGMCWHINGFGTDIKDKYNSFCSWAERREDG